METVAPSLRERIFCAKKIALTISPEKLLEQVEAHRLKLHQQADDAGALPTDIADHIAKSVTRLLTTEPIAKEASLLVRAAAYYFVEEEDEVADSSSIFGLDDDLEMFNQVMRIIGRPEFILED